MLRVKHLDHWATCLRTGIVWLENPSSPSRGEVSAGRAKTTGEHFRIVGSSDRFVVWRSSRADSRSNLSLGIVDESREATEVPKVHSIRETSSDVLGPADPWCRLQYRRYKHQRLFGVPVPLPGASELVGEHDKEALPFLALRHGVAGRR